jgi:hypothetical protein
MKFASVRSVCIVLLLSDEFSALAGPVRKCVLVFKPGWLLVEAFASANAFLAVIVKLLHSAVSLSSLTSPLDAR